MVERASITPKVFKWARETAKISLAIAAAKVSVKPEKIEEWENGEAQPTIRQAKILANAYQRSFAIFFLPDIPNDFQPLQDFRKKESVELSTSTLFINSADWAAPQLFTLVHELAHIWIASTGISNHITPIITEIDRYHPIELFCNEIAANALMPKEYILSLDNSDFINSKSVFKIAKQLGVSTFALLVRANKLNKINQKVYSFLKNQADEEFLGFLERESEKGKTKKTGR